MTYLKTSEAIAKLTPQQRHVTQDGGTERAGSLFKFDIHPFQRQADSAHH